MLGIRQFRQRLRGLHICILVSNCDFSFLSGSSIQSRTVSRGKEEARNGNWRSPPRIVCEGLVERGWPWKVDNMSSNCRSKTFDTLPNLSNSQFC